MADYNISRSVSDLTKNLAQAIKQHIASVGDEIINDKDLLDAYNCWNESQCDAVDYIFDLRDNVDLACCIQGGMNADDIVSLHKDMDNGKTSFFMFGVNHHVPVCLSKSNYRNIIDDAALDIAADVIKYPFVGAYTRIYKKYITYND